MNITPYEIKILSQQVEVLKTHLATCREYDIGEFPVHTKIGLKGARKLLADLNWSLELDIALPLEKRHNYGL